jgi:hypothetical protein
MKFDENGNRITGIHKMQKMHLEHNGLVVELESKYTGISDSTLNTVLQMVHENRISDFHSILGQLNSFKGN